MEGSGATFEWRGSRLVGGFALFGALSVLAMGIAAVVFSPSLAGAKAGMGPTIMAASAAAQASRRTIRFPLQIPLIFLPILVFERTVIRPLPPLSATAFVTLGLGAILVGAFGVRTAIGQLRRPRVLRLTSEGIERSDGPPVAYAEIARAVPLSKGQPPVALILRRPQTGWSRGLKGYDLVVGEDVRARDGEILAALAPRLDSPT